MSGMTATGNEMPANAQAQAETFPSLPLPVREDRDDDQLQHAQHRQRLRSETDLLASGLAWDERRKEWVMVGADAAEEPQEETEAESSGSTSTIVGEDMASCTNGDVLKERCDGDVEKSAGEEPIIWEEWVEGDAANPYNWPLLKKWTTTMICCSFTMLVALVASSYAVMTPSLIRDLDCSPFLSTLGLAVYPLAFGLAPLVFAPFSEAYGRYRMYVATSTIFFLVFIPTALANNIWTVIISRFISGIVGSSGSTLVGGTIADLFETKQRGAAMCWFSMFAFGGTGLGPVMFGYVEMNPMLGWRWVQWIQMMLAFALVTVMTLFTNETRGSVILSRRAEALRNSTGANHQCRSDSERSSLIVLIKTSLTRPIYLIFTEAIVFSFSMWVGVAWGVLYLTLEAVPFVLGSVYSYNIGEIGLSFATVILAGAVGGITNLYQERLYQQNVAKRGPEARLYGAMVGGLLFPIGIFLFAFTAGRTSAVGPLIALFILFFGVFTIYLAVFNYLADCYTVYASSALAGQSMFRNLAGFAFPLFTNAMYTSLGYQWASFLAGCIGLVLSATPYILFYYGPIVRERSQFAKELARMTEGKGR